MELIEIITFINLVVVSPIWFAISSLKNDIRELRQTEKQILLKLLESSHDK